MHPTIVRRGALALACVALLAPAARAAGEKPEAQPVTVFAAASLSEPFEDLAKLFRREHPGYELRFSFAGSQQLAAQIDQGAGVDLFASADERWMSKVVSRSLIAGAPHVFARNRMAVIVPANNPGQVRGLEDLSRKGLRIVMCALNVPAGYYSRQVLANLAGRPGFPGDYAVRVDDNLVSQEDNVKAVVAKVRLGEADAGFVYRTDVSKTVKRHLKVLPLPDEANVTATYAIGVLGRAPQPEGAKAFVELLLSPRGQAVLARHGFLPAVDAKR